MTEAFQHPAYRLGRKAARFDRRTLSLANYLDAAVLPPIPTALDRSADVAAWPVMLNDRIGDCTCAAAGHLIQLWSKDKGNEVVVPDDAILAAYSAVSGYDPASGARDDGAVEIDVLNYWRTAGVGGHTIAAYAALDPRQTALVRAAVYLFGGVYAGLSLPALAADQIAQDVIWDVPEGGPVGRARPGSWGGHAVPIVGYNSVGVACVTWGQIQAMTWRFWLAYAEEAYAVLSPDWVKDAEVTPEGFNVTQLMADLAAIGAV